MLNRGGLVRSYVFVPTLLLLLSGTAAAQDLRHRLEVFAGAGTSRVGGDEGSLGTGPVVVAGGGVRVSRRTSIEVDLLAAGHDRLIAGGPLEGTATGLFGSVLYHFAEGRAQVFVMGSAGILRSRTTHTFPQSNDTSVTLRSDVTDASWGGGAGAKLFVRRQLFVRPQFRIVFSEATGVLGLTSASLALGYGW